MYLRSFSPKRGRFIWFDIETTGFNQFHNDIIEIAAVDNLGNTFNQLINIGDKKLPKKIYPPWLMPYKQNSKILFLLFKLMF